MVPLLVINDSIFVFDVDHVRILRDHGIVGVLVGSLPKAPQQNVFLGLPLQLSIYEAIWSVQAGIATLVDGLKFNTFLASKNKGSALITLPSAVPYAITYDTHRHGPGDDLTPFTILPEDMISQYCKMETNYAESRVFWPHYLAFKYLRDSQYFMMPGLRFGGAFVAYPGDPLKFHSHWIVKVLRPQEEIDLLKLVTSGRLATAVKKAWLLVSEEEVFQRGAENSITASPKMQAFSIEWAGFG
ncbi:hypothetical protein OXX59_006964 [Metschnikowia pulcherrima]